MNVTTSVSIEGECSSLRDIRDLIERIVTEQGNNPFLRFDLAEPVYLIWEATVTHSGEDLLEPV